MINRKKGSEQLKHQMVDIYIHDSLSGIKRRGKDPEDTRQQLSIRSHLHLMVLTSNEYSLQTLKGHLGDFKCDGRFHPGDRQPNYGSKWIRWFRHGIFMNIFTNPVYPFLPLCYVEIHQKGNFIMGRYKRFVSELASTFPSLKVAKVEYANDVYCLNPSASRDLFEAIRRFLYVPYQRSAVLDYGDQLVDLYGESNRVYRVGNRIVYERGKDGDKSGEGWAIDVLDRVRLEHSAKRRQLMKNGISTISDFVKNPKFYELNKNIYRFVNFTGSNCLPKVYDAYNSDSGMVDSFEGEYIYHRNAKTVKNIGQYTIDTSDFKEVLSTLHECWSRFDRNWQGHIIC